MSFTRPIAHRIASNLWWRSATRSRGNGEVQVERIPDVDAVPSSARRLATESSIAPGFVRRSGLRRQSLLARSKSYTPALPLSRRSSPEHLSRTIPKESTSLPAGAHVLLRSRYISSYMPCVDGETCRNTLLVASIAANGFICSSQDQWLSPAACGAGSADDLAAPTIEAMITALRVPKILAGPLTEILESPRQRWRR
jgi:hypothetical protein